MTNINRILQLTGLLVIMLSGSTCVKKVGNKSVYFNEDILPIFVSNCAQSGCHNAVNKKEGYDFTSYEGIMKGVVAGHPLRSEVYTVIRGSNPSMPEQPYSKLSQANVELIKLWINMGAPNSVNTSSCDSLNIKFTQNVKPIIDTWCLGCHNNTSSGGGINLSDYNGVKRAVSSGALLASIKHQAGYSKMPQGGVMISSCNIAVIENWIKKGYLNN